MSVPKLRFPEFWDAGEWSEKLLEDALSPIVRQRKKPINPYIGLGLRSHGKGTFLKNLEIPEKNSMEHLYEVESDDLIVNITFAWEGAIAIAQQTDAGALVSHRFPTYTFKRNTAIPEFFQYIILDKQFIYKLGVISPGGAGRNRVLNKNDFLKLTTLLPDINEQQKIADCLSSLDDLIAAQSQKLDTLKAYKKGLMQQLFPAEGETLPHLRFPEFRDASEWEEKNITSIAKTSIGLVTTMTTSYSDDGVPLIRNSDIQPNKVRKEKLIYLLDSFADKYSNKKLKEGDIVTVHTGDIGVSAVIDNTLNGCLGFATLNTRLLTTDVLPQYVCWYYNTERYINFAISMATGDGRNNFNLKDFDKSLIPIPSLPEQQKIADCLSNLDELITAQSQKLDALKAHKKGLMQQLFPALDEVPG